MQQKQDLTAYVSISVVDWGEKTDSHLITLSPSLWNLEIKAIWLSIWHSSLTNSGTSTNNELSH